MSRLKLMLHIEITGADDLVNKQDKVLITDPYTKDIFKNGGDQPHQSKRKYRPQ